MNKTNQDLLRRHMEVLDYMKGEGLFPRAKRSVNKSSRYLIIGYGGTGCDALEEIKKLLKDELPEEEFNNYVRFLAIDSDENARVLPAQVEDELGVKHSMDKERFTVDEWFWLDGRPARQAITIKQLEGMESWLNPKLPPIIDATPTMLDGTGASAIRQVGRLMLSAGATPANFKTKIQAVVSGLMAGTAANLNVFIVTGIAGGTGSGIVVDATYLIRHTINEMPANIGNRTQYCGFIMLPPTGDGKGVDPKGGNTRGVAAMKEIDHFMTLTMRKERYSHQFGTINVNVDQNIFDSCYLLDGTQNMVMTKEPRKKAMEVAKSCILDMITSGDANVMPIQSFMSNVASNTMTMVGNTSEKLAPRDANYIYCAIGYGQFRIPTNLLNTYVAKQVFDIMLDIFTRCGHVEEEDVEDFLEEVQCPKDGTFSGASKLSFNEFRANVGGALGKYFTVEPDANKGGPYYVINLLAMTMDELKARYNRVREMAMGSARELRCNEFKMLYDIMADFNSTYFEVYVAVFEALKHSLKENYDILFNTQKLEAFDNCSYTVTRVDFKTGDKASNTIRTYLDGLVSRANVNQMCREMVQEMMRHQNEWCQLVAPGDAYARPKFCAPKRLQEFWSVQINKIVDATLEDYLIKFFSNNPDAKWQEINGKPTPEADAQLKAAAAALVEQMWGNAGAAIPLVQLQTSILGTHVFNGMKNFLIPSAAPHLMDYVRNQLNATVNVGNTTIQVAPSTANDRITCYAQYVGIPAYMITWAANAELNDYESELKNAAVGLHISETKGGAQWREFPNLIKEQVYDKIGPAYQNPREMALNQNSRNLLSRAQALGLTIVKAIPMRADVGYYTLKYLDDAYVVDAQFLRDLDSEKEGTDARAQAQSALDAEIENRARALFEKQNWVRFPKVAKAGMADALAQMEQPVALKQYALDYASTVLTPAPATKKPEDWEENLAAALLRTTPEHSYKLRGTILVLERLYEMISEAQAVNYRRDRFLHYLVAELFSFDEDEGEWYYVTAAGVRKSLLVIPYGYQAMETAQYYFMFQEFNKDANNIIADLDPDYMDMVTGSTNAERRQKARAIAEKRDALVEKVIDLMTYDRSKPTRPCLGSPAFVRQAEAKNYNVEEIRQFYQTLADELEMFTAE